MFSFLWLKVLKVGFCLCKTLEAFLENHYVKIRNLLEEQLQELKLVETLV